MRRSIGLKLFSLSVLITVLAVVFPATGLAAEQSAVIETGTWGTCPWEASEGTLTVYPGEGAEYKVDESLPYYRKKSVRCRCQ